jgi:signal transduction histidine kinase
VTEVAAEVAHVRTERFHAADLRLDLSLSPVMVWADPQRLSQVVTNLLTNASKYTPAGGHVHVSVRGQAGMARLEVTDSGPGISPHERDKIFERFYRGDAGRRTGGTGIGLVVVKQLVEAHGREVTTQNPPQGGVSFVVLLPAAQPADHE